MYTPIMPVKVIKQILIKENASFFDHKEYSAFGLEYYQYVKLLVQDKIESLSSYDDINDFMRASRRMSLKEWIDSL